MSCFAVAALPEIIDLTQLTLVDSARKGSAKNGGKKRNKTRQTKKVRKATAQQRRRKISKTVKSKQPRKSPPQPPVEEPMTDIPTLL